MTSSGQRRVKERRSREAAMGREGAGAPGSGLGALEEVLNAVDELPLRELHFCFRWKMFSMRLRSCMRLIGLVRYPSAECMVRPLSMVVSLLEVR